MTTLDRLYKKGFIERRLEGRAFVYTSARTREQIAAGVTGGLLRGLLASDPGAARPILSNLVDAVGEGHEGLLDELEQLVRDKRRRIRSKQ
jgi:predicted transcriptional regulator